jgi:hypothetical protein
MGGACCRLNDPEVYKEKLIDVQQTDTGYSINKVIKIQSFFRGSLYRFKFGLRNINNRIRILTRKASLIKSDDLHEVPGKLIDINIVKFDEIVTAIEDKLGDFIIEEKELITYIRDYKQSLKNISFQYDDGSIYYGYYNNIYEREGYGILILPDGSKYQGFFKNNKMNGRGRLISSDGDYYEGLYC